MKKCYPPVLREWLLLAAPFLFVILVISAAENSQTSVYSKTIYNEASANEVETFYPAPTDNFICLEPPVVENHLKINIINDLGAKIKEVDLSLSLYIKISDLPPGLYSIKCASTDDVIGKFVKR